MTTYFAVLEPSHNNGKHALSSGVVQSIQKRLDRLGRHLPTKRVVVVDQHGTRWDENQSG